MARVSLVSHGVGQTAGNLRSGVSNDAMVDEDATDKLFHRLTQGACLMVDQIASFFSADAENESMVEHISLRSLRLRHPRGPVHTIPFGGMGTVTSNSRDYIISKLDFRVRYDTNVDKVSKIPEIRDRVI